MKITLAISVSILILVCCNNPKKVILESGTEYWSENHAGDTTTLHTEYEFYSLGSDTLVQFTNYYKNGNLKSKVLMKNDLLVDIEFVLDTLGDKMNFGSIKNGNGYVIEFSDDDGAPENERLYVNGDKEGWWKNYHFNGYILDSVFYKEGYAQRAPSIDTLNTLDQLLDLFDPIKNNYYR